MGKLDEIYMKRCLELAAMGRGFVSPNPMVGAVLVHKDRIIGEGYHHKFGGDHAEVIAIRSVSKKELLSEATLYVSLEPCSHYGKTPPCADLVVSSGIPRVVIACKDPNPDVAGKGIEKLRNAGIDVIYPVLEEESKNLNKRFFTRHEKRRPYIILKWAETADGFIDMERAPGEPLHTNWITNHTARMLVHRWRAEEDSIMVGVNTILTDDPGLDTREWPGKSPVRVLIDLNGRVRGNFRILNQKVKTLVYNKESGSGGSDKDKVLVEVLEDLSNKGIHSMIVEGGTKLIESFIRIGLWDEARVFVGNVKFDEGKHGPELKTVPATETVFRGNRLKFMLNNS